MMISTPRRVDKVCPAVPLKCEQHMQAVLVFSGGTFCAYTMLMCVMCVRWSAASPLSGRLVEAHMQGPWVSVDHVAINRWVWQDSPLLDAAFCRCNCRCRSSSGWTKRP